MTRGHRAAPAQATAPGTNGRIAYSRFADATFRHADIVSANPDGTGLRKLTKTPAGTYDFNPDWSPDGTKVAFQRDTPVGGGIDTVNADGSNLRQITFAGFGDQDPAWSPDGTRFAVEHFDLAAGRDGIYTVNIDGGNYAQITQNDTRRENEEPQWSPDGTKLVFQIVSETAGSAIFTVNLDGTDERQLTPYGLDAGRSLIVFESYTDSPPPGVSTNVFTVRPDGTDLTQITQNEGGEVNSTNPAWAPDGTKIVFAQTPGSRGLGYSDVFTMNADGSGINQVTSSTFWDFRPDWGSQP